MLESPFDYSLDTFLGVRFILRGFDSDREADVRLKLLEGGGTDAADYGSNCNYVIVDKLVYDDPICIAARRDGKILVTGLWVDHSFDVGMPVDHTSVMYWPMKDLDGIPGAKSLVVCATGYQRQDREDIMTMVALMGANFSKPLIARNTTHLICYKFEGEKYRLAKKMDIKIINHSWLEDCLKAWELLPEIDYATSGYELEMEAEVKDSEEETEDMASINLRMRSIVSPQIKNNILHQSPSKQDVSRNTTYLSASANFANVGDTSKIKSTPAEERIHDKSTSSCARSPVKKSSEKVECAKASASRNSDKFPGAVLANLSSMNRKSTLPLRSERSSPVALNEAGAKTPLKESSFPSTKKATASNLKSPSLSISGKKIVGTESTPKGTKLLVSGSCRLVGDGIDMLSQRLFDRMVSDDVKMPSKVNLLNHCDWETGSFSSKTKTSLSHGNSRLPISNCNPATSIGSGAALLVSGSSLASHMGGEVLLSTKEAFNSTTLEDRSPHCLEKQSLSNLDSANPFRRTIACTVGEEMYEQGDFNAENRNNQSKPKNSNMLAGKTFGSKPTIHNGSTVKHMGLNPSSIQNEITNLSNEALAMELTDIAANPEKVYETKTPDETEQKEVGRNDIEQSNKVGASSPIKEVSTKELADSEAIRVEEKSATSKGSTAQHKGLVNAAALPNEITNHSNGAAALELTGAAAVPDEEEQNEFEMGNDDIEQCNKVGASSSVKKASRTKKQASCKTVQNDAGCKWTANGEGLVNANNITNLSNAAVAMELTNDDPIPEDIDETKAIGEKETIEFENGSDVEHFDNVRASKSGKNSSHRKKQTNCKTVQLKEKSTKSVKNNDLPEPKSTSNAEATTKGKKRPLTKSKTNKLRDSREEEKNYESERKQDEDKPRNNKRPSKKLKSSGYEDKDNENATVRQQSESNDTREVTLPLEKFTVETEPVVFILSGRRPQRKEFQKVIKQLKGRVCRDSHSWSYQATHFIVPDPVRRTEKFFAAAASGCWIMKTDYLKACNEAGRFLPEEPYEWHEKSYTEDGLISLLAPRRWRLFRERTGRGAFYGMRIVTYGDFFAPTLDTLKRAVKAGDGTILATSPPYTRFLNSGVDFAVVSLATPREDIWVQEFMRHQVPCVVADYLVEHVCRLGLTLDKHVLYKTHEWAQKSMDAVMNRMEEVEDDDIACVVCGSHDRGDEMLICGDESGSRGCGVGTHIGCLDPPLVSVPEDDWFCHQCLCTSKSNN